MEVDLRRLGQQASSWNTNVYNEDTDERKKELPSEENHDLAFFFSKRSLKKLRFLDVHQLGINFVQNLFRIIKF